jgi:hypothetical protein
MSDLIFLKSDTKALFYILMEMGGGGKSKNATPE